MPRELELECRDVPTGLATDERAAADPVTCEPAERLACLGADDTVDLDTRASLKAADRFRGRGASDPVDRAPVEPMRTQTDLEGGDARAGRGALGGCERRDENKGQCKKRPDSHGGRPFSPWSMRSLDSEHVFV